MTTSGEIWHSVQRRAVRGRRAQVAHLREFLQRIDNPHARILSGRLSAKQPDKESALTLESEIVGHYRKGKITKGQAASWLGLTYAAIKEFSAQGIKLEPTWLADEFHPASSPFAPEPMRARERVDRWRTALFDWLREHGSENPREAWQAGILLSAVLNGALVDVAKLKLLLERLNQEDRPDTSNPYSMLAFDLPYQGMGNYHLQRWVLDPISEMLIWRLPESGNNLQFPDFLDRMRALFRAAGLADHHTPSSVFDLVACAATWWSGTSSQIEIKASMRRFKTHALDSATWLRLHHRSAPERASRTRDDADLQEAPESEESLFDELPSVYPWLGDAEAVLETDTIDTARQSCMVLLSVQPDKSLAKTYLGWLDFMLSGKGATRDALAFSTIRQRFRVTVPRLVAILVDQDPSQMDTLQLEDFYSELTSDVDPEVPINDLSRGLRDFHAYLRCQFGKKPVSDEAEVFGETASLKPVSAKLITFDEYIAVLAWLDQQTYQGWSLEEILVCKVVLILGFRAGLRRMEIFGLRLEDIDTHQKLVALIRPYHERRLKTENSTRSCPLHALLPFSERQLIRAWVEERERAHLSSARNIGKTAYLFPKFDSLTAQSWIARVCNDIMRGLQAVTGQRLLIHHLRHSFATWTYLRLRAPDFPMIAAFFSHLPITASVLRSGRRFRVRLLYRSESPSAAFAFAVARLLGHSSPAVSLGHYVHASDLLVGAVTWREIQGIPVPVLVAASGLRQPTAYKKLIAGLPALVSGCREVHRKQQSPQATVDQPVETPVIKRRGPHRKADPHLSSEWISFATRYKVLTASISVGISESKIAEDLNLDPQRVCALLDAAATWGHHIGLSISNGRLAEVPSKPRGDGQRSYANTLEEKLAAMARRAPDLYLEGLSIHLKHFRQEKGDVVFKGKKEARELKRYLHFLHSLGVAPSGFQWLVRQPDSPSAHLPDWAAAIDYRWLPKTTKRIAPPGLQKASSYGQWLGIQPVDESGAGVGKLMATAMFLAIISHASPVTSRATVE